MVKLVHFGRGAMLIIPQVVACSSELVVPVFDLNGVEIHLRRVVLAGEEHILFLSATKLLS